MLYGEAMYGEYMYGDDSGDSTEEEEDIEVYRDLKKYVPFFILDMDEYDALYDAAGYEVGRLKYYLDALFAQNLVSTATWSISKWESIYGVKGSDSQTIAQRRAAVIAKMQTRKTCTPDLIEEVAYTITSVNARVIENNPEYTFTVYFYGQYGIPTGIASFKRQLEIIKPAHLAYEIQYRYVIWDELTPYTWSEVKSYTWDSIRIWVIEGYVSWDGINTAGFTWKAIKAYTCNTVKTIEEAKVY